MRVLGVNNRIYNSQSFGRKPTDKEAVDMQKTINQAYDAMGTKERIAITHGSCFPALGKDAYIGSPFGKAANEYIKFLALYGFNGNQLGPNGELVKGNHSPYNSSAFAKNRLFIDLSQLNEDNYAHILTDEEINDYLEVPKPTEFNYTYTDFEEANSIYDEALKTAYKNFKEKLQQRNPEALALNKEFKTYLKADHSKNDKRLTEEGIFNVLSNKYKTDEFLDWDDVIDSNLIVLVKDGNLDANIRYNELYNDNKEEIEQYKFEQFLASKQIKENKEFRDKIGFKYFSDMLVGCSKMDHWRYKDAFIDGYQIGADSRNGLPQAWDSPILHPRKLFKGNDRHLGKAGLFLQDKLDSALEFCENVRIDHVMGLIEPFVIDSSSIIYGEVDPETGKKKILNDFNVYDDNNNIIKKAEKPINAAYMSQMRTADGKPLDDHKNYSCDYTHNGGYKTYHSNIMNEIVLPVLKKHDLEKDDPVWEDICTQPEPFWKVYYENLNMPRLNQLEWSRAQKGSDKDWYLVGSHDSIPAQNMIKRDWTRNSEAWEPAYLAGYLNMHPERVEAKAAFEEKIKNDDKEWVKAKFAELLTTKKFQISFADLLGITDEDVVYNVGGSNREDNWKLRISPDFIDKYYENLASESPTAINIPEVLKMAVQAKLDMLKLGANGNQEKLNELDAKFQPIIDKLGHYEEILKE